MGTPWANRSVAQLFHSRVERYLLVIHHLHEFRDQICEVHIPLNLTRTFAGLLGNNLAGFLAQKIPVKLAGIFFRRSSSSASHGVHLHLVGTGTLTGKHGFPLKITVHHRNNGGIIVHLANQHRHGFQSQKLGSMKTPMSRLYNYVNFDRFKDLPVTGTNGEPFIEEIVNVDPQVIVMSSYASQDPDELTQKTGIPVVVVPGSDTTLDEKAYTTIRILGELYHLGTRAADLSEYLEGIQKDLDERTASIPDEQKPTCYVGGVSFKGQHGFEGTEAYYGPFELIHANNLANTTDQSGAFNIDVEQVLAWDPEVIFLDFNGMSLINEDYAVNPDFYNALTAVQEGKVYSQISFRSSASNLETALADAYYAACVMYPEQFSDVDPIEKAGEIFTELLGTNPYDDLKGAGYEFRPITIGE